MFDSLSDRITGSFKNLRSKGRLSASDVEETVSEIRRALLDADVALPVVRSFTAAVREKATGALSCQALNPSQQIVKIVNDELVEILGGESREITWSQQGPTVIMLAGLQGAGKTTLAGKLGLWMRTNDHKVLLVASDLQRPNAVTQLEVVGKQAGVDVWAPQPGALEARRRYARWRSPFRTWSDRRSDSVRLDWRKAHGVRTLPRRSHGFPNPRYGRYSHSH